MEIIRLGLSEIFGNEFNIISNEFIIKNYEEFFDIEYNIFFNLEYIIGIVDGSYL